ncbi:MAG: aminodeoxychorismate synthase component I, partial [Armatimonadetes bacterium]|nr:aminodeoxychorismate synthase component I [Armatimonadota bacterium]
MVEQAILRDARESCWRCYTCPVDAVTAHRLDEIPAALAAVEAAVEQGLVAVGYLAYEAAPAFDPALEVREGCSLPLLAFGFFAPVGPSEPPLPAAGCRLGEWQPDTDRASYEQAIAAIKEAIARGETYQVNYTLRLRASFEGDPYALARQLWRAQPTSYGAWLDLGEQAICSVSPELFFRREGDRLLSRPMKGTRPRGLTLEGDQALAADLKAAEKDRAENLMIVDMIRNDLGRVAELGSVEVPELFRVERYETLWQMTSSVTARSRASLPALLGALFPCASITGAPKVQTMKLIAGLEASPRGVYTGAIGFVSQQRTQFNVAIRTVQVDRRRGLAEYGVGGGVVWDSTAAGEYEEWRTKAMVLTARQP